MDLRATSFVSSTPSPTAWQGANDYSQPITSSYHPTHELDSEPGGFTNYVDMALAIVRRDSERLKSEHSYTWPGRLLNWAFGWGEYSIKKLDASTEGDKLTERVPLVQAVYNKASMEGVRKKAFKKTSESTYQVYLQSSKEMSASTALQKRSEEAYEEYSKNATAAVGVIASMSLVGILAMLLCTYKTKWPQKCYASCLSKPYHSNIQDQDYDEVLDLE